MAGWQANAIGGENRCPAVLFRGTKREHLQAIRTRGLAPRWPEVDAVYLIDDLLQALANSGGIDRQTETFDLDCLLVVDVTGPADVPAELLHLHAADPARTDHQHHRPPGPAGPATGRDGLVNDALSPREARVTRWPGFAISGASRFAERPRGTDTYVRQDLGDIALNLLADLLGAEVIATGPPRSPLPVTGRCSRCGSPTTVYGPRGRPICDQCRDAQTAEDAEPA